MPSDSNTLPTTVAWILFGSVTMVMFAFYFVNFRDKDIRDATWMVISNAMALFCAILIFLSFREFIALITDGEEVRRLGSSDSDWAQCWEPGAGERRLMDTLARRLAGPPTQKTLTIDALCFVFLFGAWETVLFFVRKRPVILSALGLVGAHCMGFATLYAFGNMQQCVPFRESPGLSLVVFIVAAVALALLCLLCDIPRQWLTRRVDSDGAHHAMHHWTHQCKHSEREALAFALSFLLAQVLDYIATQRLAVLHAVPKGRDIENATAEFGFVAGLSFLVILAGFTEQAIASHHGHHELEIHIATHHAHHGHEMTNSQLAMHMLKDTLAFTTGWSCLDAIKLAFWSTTNDKGLLGEGDVMTSHVVIVLLCSAVTFAGFYIIDFIADRVHGKLGRGLRALGKAVCLMLGLAWEAAFWEGAHKLSEGMGLEEKTSRMLVVIISSLTLVAVVMPAWIMYIVPQTIEIKDEELHVKDYDDHESPTHTPKHTDSMVTMHGDAIHDGFESRSTSDGQSGDGHITPPTDEEAPNVEEPSAQPSGAASKSNELNSSAASARYADGAVLEDIMPTVTEV